MHRALKFYCDLLGMKKCLLDNVGSGLELDRIVALDNAQLHVVMLELDDGNCIELLQYLSHPRDRADHVESCDIGCSHIALEVNDVDTLCKRLEQEGITINTPPLVNTNGYAKVTYVHDYDGTIVELVQVLDETKSPYKQD